MEKKIIRLWSDGRCWLVEYTGPEAKEISTLMGTVMIPTAYTAKMPRHEVIERIKNLNPGYEVI